MQNHSFWPHAEENKVIVKPMNLSKIKKVEVKTEYAKLIIKMTKYYKKDEYKMTRKKLIRLRKSFLSLCFFKVECRD